MYAEERQQAMAEAVAATRRLSVSDAAARFGVTTETVRRDLAVLERDGLVRRVHGGAVAADALTGLELGLVERDTTMVEEKDAIARAALSLLPGDRGSVILDAGTTTRRLASALPNDIRLTVFTNAPMLVPTLTTGRERIDVQLIGGRVRTNTHAAVGPRAVSALHRIRADVAFVGTNGLSFDFGLSTPDVDEAAVKRGMVEAGRQVVVLADSSKFDVDTLNQFAELPAVDVVITDSGVSDRYRRTLESMQIEVVLA